MNVQSTAEQIGRRLDPTFERDLFLAALNQSQIGGNPLRAHNFATAVRELTRHVLHRLGPEDKLVECEWYVEEKERGEVIFTREQRILFAIQGGLSDEYLSKSLGLDYVQVSRKLRRTITTLNKLTHINEDTFLLREDHTDFYIATTLDAFAQFLVAIEDCRERVTDAVEEHVNDAVFTHIIEETLEHLWTFAPHYAVTNVRPEISCSGIDGLYVYFSVSGSIDVELQYGSAGDRSRGDGMELDEEVTFTCRAEAPVEDPETPVVVEESFEVDYSNLEERWHE